MATENIETAGSGGDHATIAAWASATASGPVTDDTIEVCELLDSTYNEAVNFQSTDTSATQYRVVRPASGVDVAWSNTGNACKIKEDNFFLMGHASDGSGSLSIDCTDGGSAARYPVNVLNNANNVRIWGVKVTFSGVNTNTANACIQVTAGSDANIIGCVVDGDNGGGTGAAFGIKHVSNLGGDLIAHNTVYGVNRTAFLGYGIFVQYSGKTVQNNICLDNSFFDFLLHASTTVRSNLSSDATATGVNSQINETAADTVTDHTTGDFTLTPGSAAIDIGTDLSPLVDYDGVYSDFIGDTHNGDAGGTEIGAYDYATIQDLATVMDKQAGFDHSDMPAAVFRDPVFASADIESDTDMVPYGFRDPVDLSALMEGDSDFVAYGFRDPVALATVMDKQAGHPHSDLVAYGFRDPVSLGVNMSSTSDFIATMHRDPVFLSIIMESITSFLAEVGVEITTGGAPFVAGNPAIEVSSPGGSPSASSPRVAAIEVAAPEAAIEVSAPAAVAVEVAVPITARY